MSDEMRSLRQRVSALETAVVASKVEETTLQGRVRYLEAEMGTLNLKIENMREGVVEQLRRMGGEIAVLKSKVGDA